MVVAIASFAVGAAPLRSPSPSEPVSPRISLLHQALIYAKEGSKTLVDGRWNLGQSKSKLGIKLTPDETKQLMACTGQIVCEPAKGQERVTASAVSVLKPDLLVTAQHVFFKGKRQAVSFGRCSFRSFLHRNVAVPVTVEKDQRRGYVFNNEDFIVLRLKRPLEGCDAFAISASDASLSAGEQVFSVTAEQRRTLNKLSRREPVLAKGQIRNVFDGFFGGPPFYHADIDFDVGGSGGAVFALKDGRPVADEDGRLVLKGIVVAYALNARNNRPYSEDRNFTIVIGLEQQFRDVVKGKAQKPDLVESAPCAQDGVAEIDVIAEEFMPSLPSDALAASMQEACSSGQANAACTALAKELKQLKGIKRAAARRTKQKYEFRLKNDTSCPICFSYDRCNGYGCWDQAVRLSGKSLLFAGVREEAPAVKNPQFCQAQPAATFQAAKDKAERMGVEMLTAEDIRGLSLEQIRELRGY